MDSRTRSPLPTTTTTPTTRTAQVSVVAVLLMMTLLFQCPPHTTSEQQHHIHRHHHHNNNMHDNHNGALQDDPISHDGNCARNLHESDSITIDLRLKNVSVPSTDTTYMCQTFDLHVTPDLDRHMIAVLPIIDAEVVVHHILLFGCDPRLPAIEDTDAPSVCSIMPVGSCRSLIGTWTMGSSGDCAHPQMGFRVGPRGYRQVFMQPGPQETDTDAPSVCGIMPVESCRSLIGTWTMGSSGDCAHPQMGFRVGPRGYRQVFMQVHFNNPNLLEGIMDSSGLRIHLTQSLRPNDAGMLVVGQRSLQINPLEYQDGGAARDFTPADDEEATRYVSDKATFTADCPSRCTQHMFGDKGVFITSVVNHMHTLGVSQRIELYRNNTLVHTITDQDNYDYNHPVIFRFDEPIHVLPGDELRTTCVYKRPTNTRHPVCFGEATSDEMCFGFITYYPTQPLKYPWCTSMGSMKSCDRHLPQLGLQPINGCKWWEFRDVSQSQTKMMFGRVLMSCYSSNTRGSLQCGDQCKTIVNSIVSHPCMQGDVGAYMIDRIKQGGESGQMLMDALLTCSCRQFRYCDRRLPKGLLGSMQPKFCPSNDSPPPPTASARWPGLLLWSSIAVYLNYYHVFFAV